MFYATAIQRGVKQRTPMLDDTFSGCPNISDGYAMLSSLQRSAHSLIHRWWAYSAWLQSRHLQKDIMDMEWERKHKPIFCCISCIMWELRTCAPPLQQAMQTPDAHIAHASFHEGEAWIPSSHIIQEAQVMLLLSPLVYILRKYPQVSSSWEHIHHFLVLWLWDRY